MSLPSTLIPVNISNGADRHMEEKVPNISPNNMGKQKSKMTFPPKKQRAKSERTVVKEVKTVLDRVSLMALFRSSATLKVRYISISSRILSKTTTVSWME
jgi:hypothetical protein